MHQLPLGVQLREAARFTTFVAGANGQLVETLASSNPDAGAIWLWGRAGAGKTHLLQAVCAAAGECGRTAAYIDLGAGLAPGVLDGLESVAVACIDGIEHVAADMAWNEALFRLYTLLTDSRGRLVVASCRAPAAIAFALADLRSRLLAAQIFQLSELDDSGRQEALELRARSRGLELSDDAARWLVEHLPRDMHSLCRALDRLDSASLVAQRRLTVPFLRESLSDQLPGGD
jgi:DnaA family protein